MTIDRPTAVTAPAVAAVVLCGGTSRRMSGDAGDGVDKTALPVAGDGRTVLDALLDGLPASWRVVAVGEPRPTRRAVTWTREDPPLGGPLAGTAAGLAATGSGAAARSGPTAHTGVPGDPADACAAADAGNATAAGDASPVTVVVAGDQPFAGAAAVAVADALAAAPTDVDAVAAARPGTTDEPQLLLAAYRTPALAGALRGVDVTDRGVHRTLRGLRVRTVPVGDAATLDVDTPADLAHARDLAGRDGA